ncbi:hypothetical protein WJX84_004677 [Apatococcus fuscideae]|uniref:Uncharacterized protein n=1 Tax=Apatococcus fuscideae TaxID=2026836 RepID=A0AAW1TA50_9CHLO
MDAAKSQDAARAKEAAKAGPASAPAAGGAAPQVMRNAPPRKMAGRKRPAKAPAAPRERPKDKSGQFTTDASAAESAAVPAIEGAVPGELPPDNRIQQLATVASDQQFVAHQDPHMGGAPPQFPPGIDPQIPGQPMMPFDQPPPVPVPVQTKEQEMAIMKERNDGLPLSKEESDDEVHPLPDAASGFRKRQKKIDHIPVRSSSIPGMTVGNVRKTLNQIRKAGNAIKSEHLLWNGWPAGRFALAYIKGHHEKRKQGKKATDPEDEDAEEETGDEAGPPEAPPAAPHPAAPQPQ